MVSSMSMSMDLPSGRVLVTGALGQIGTELVEALRKKHGHEAVIATDIRKAEGCQILNVMEKEDFLSKVYQGEIDIHQPIHNCIYFDIFLKYY